MIFRDPFWDDLAAPGPESVVVDGITLRRGSRVRIRPGPGGDVLDLALAGKTALVESLEQDADGAIHLVLVVEDDPGRELDALRMPAHRFFYSVEEVEPILDAASDAAPSARPGPASAEKGTRR